MKDEKIKETTEIVLRKRLLRCFNDIVKKFPELLDLPKEKAVDRILTLRREGEIRITLNTVDNLINTRIDWVS
ncbi:MAG: hypothetical protein JRL30_20950 [Deltaproteobacteria bacterium]|nr:hypothetical protein [Deltaproteobacteria bacterium]